jgi:Ca-activated chloride channel family protein
VFARSKGTVPEILEVSVEIDGKPVAWTIPVIDAGEGRLPIPTLWARERIRDLEESQESLGSRGSRQARSKATGWKDEVIAISRQYGVLSESTSYVAVEEREEKDKTTGELVLRKVPSLVTVGWHGVGSVFGNVVAQMLAGPVPSMRLAGHGPAAPASSVMRADISIMKESVAFRTVDLSPQDAPADGGHDTRADLLMALLSLQRADAGFDLDQAAARMLGFDLSLLETAASQLSSDPRENRRILSTAVVLAVLEQHFAAERSMWSAVTRKSRSWLAKTIKDRSLAIGGAPVEEWAAEFVKKNVRIA